MSANGKDSPPHGFLFPRLEEKDPDEDPVISPSIKKQKWIHLLKTLNLTRRPLRNYKEPVSKAGGPEITAKTTATTATTAVKSMGKGDRAEVRLDEPRRIYKLFVEMERAAGRTHSGLYRRVRRSAAAVGHFFHWMLPGSLATLWLNQALEWPAAKFSSTLDYFFDDSPEWIVSLEREDGKCFVYSFYSTPEYVGLVTRLRAVGGEAVEQSSQRNDFAIFWPEYDISNKLKAVLIVLVATSSLLEASHRFVALQAIITMRVDLVNGFEAYADGKYAVPISIWPVVNDYEYIQDGSKQVIEAHLVAEDGVLGDYYDASALETRRKSFHFFSPKELQYEGIYLIPDMEKLGKLLRTYVDRAGESSSLQNFKGLLEEFGIYIPRNKAGQGQAFNWLTSWEGQYRLHIMSGSHGKVAPKQAFR